MGVYMHIPFCVRKCRYCDFLSGVASAESMKSYVDVLKKEIFKQAMKYSGEYGVRSIYFGGGTPSLLPAGMIAELIETVREQFDLTSGAEITVEANPGTLTEEKLMSYLKAGVTRLSMGMQSTFDDELRLLGRIHTYKEFVENYQQAVEAGFDNISVDLMLGLPGQTVDRLTESVKRLIALEPQHISAYSLILEEGTSFWEEYDEADLPEEETERLMYEKTRQLLEESGYEQYELSNYARKGYEGRHNSAYWCGLEYLGMGLGASSFMKQTRWKNATDMAQYQTNPGEPTEVEKISKNMQMEEFMFLGLRMNAGISYKKFSQKFGVALEKIYGEVIEKHMDNGLLTTYFNNQGKMLKLTKKGMDICNYVFIDFIL